ncbi:MAG: alpha-L-rhamnosidase C-terminal domain-containing protein [Terracidiphilus sp.]|nr:alpha-L-rhamnosidase C-terminal domain-containing protein [Terracidiphilus sp.]
MRPIFSAVALALAAIALGAQSPTQSANQPDPVQRDWQASWTTHPAAPLKDPVVLHFRRALALDAVPASYIVRVSADNRFILYVNGRRAGEGPARGDLGHWRYERFDLAPLLHPGANLVTATVWNFGILAPVAQITDRTAFLLESEAQGDKGISTPEGWETEIEAGQRPMPRAIDGNWDYMASGPAEELDAAKFDWSWQDPAAKAGWVKAASPMRESIYPTSAHAESALASDSPNFWGLVPDGLPPMEYSDTIVGTNVHSEFLSAAEVVGEPGKMPMKGSSPTLEINDFPSRLVTIQSGAHARLLLDRKTLTTAYPELVFSGGKGARIKLTYTEALYDKDHKKGDRDEVANRQALGITDVVLPDGGPHRSFSPLWWRTWRYLQIDVETGPEPLTLEGLTAHFTAYPFEEKARFESADPELAKIWEISWRTARLDAHETYMDTPYWEQLQYVGDTRIQALISYSVGGDDRLGRQALEAFDSSRIPDGITRSRYPSMLPQNIPTFSLLWIGMVRDWWMYRPDPEPARASLPGVRAVLGWYQGYEQPDGLLRQLPWWSFVDWVGEHEQIPTYSSTGESCVTTLEYLGALEDASALELGLGDAHLAGQFSARAARVRQGLQAQCWAADHGLVADNPDKRIFSQQANILAVLLDVIPADKQAAVLSQLTQMEPGASPGGVMSASYYFRFYLARALEHAGLGDRYLDALAPWRKLLPLHFSTWPETPEPTRSDSHAWSAHPIYDFLTLVAGIEPASPGFSTVRIAPHLGTLPSLTATYPHPQGEIKVEYQRQGAGLSATITLPGSLTGSFAFNSRNWPLKPGLNHILAP